MILKPDYAATTLSLVGAAKVTVTVPAIETLEIQDPRNPSKCAC